MAMFIVVATHPVKYINIVFAQLDVTKGKRKQEAKIKHEKLAKIE